MKRHDVPGLGPGETEQVFNPCLLSPHSSIPSSSSKRAVALPDEFLHPSPRRGQETWYTDSPQDAMKLLCWL